MFVFGLENTINDESMFVFGLENTVNDESMFVFCLENTIKDESMFFFGLENKAHNIQIKQNQSIDRSISSLLSLSEKLDHG